MVRPSLAPRVVAPTACLSEPHSDLFASPRSRPLSECIRSSQPWLTPRLFSAPPLTRAAQSLLELPVSTFALVKAFDARNDADSYASQLPTIQWACEHAACSRIFREGPTSLSTAVTSVGAPISARVATGDGTYAATPAIDRWLASLAEACARRMRDADVYVTASSCSSASLGWHLDDVDVLLVMMRGRKQFRVGGRTVGSEAVIDHVLEPGDALYIPALHFHSGGTTLAPRESSAGTSDTDSCLLSVAFSPDDAASATAVVADWRDARRALLSRLPAGGNDWAWAGSKDGRRQLARILLLNPAWECFRAG